MKTLKYKVIGLALAALCLGGCSNFLDEDPKGQISTAVAFTQASDLEGAYATLYYQSNLMWRTVKPFANRLPADDVTTCWGKDDARKLDAFFVDDNVLFTATDFGLWNSCWLYIRCANYIKSNADKLKNVDQSEAFAKEVDMLKAQCEFWEAYCYFALVNCFGPVPIMTQKDYDECNMSVVPSPIEDVCNYVVELLKHAEEVLPVTFKGTRVEKIGWSGSNNIMAGKAAVQAVLSYVYLTMAGYPLNKGNEYYALAATEAKKIIDASSAGNYPYMLQSDYNNVHNSKLDMVNPEHILNIPFCHISSNLGLDAKNLTQTMDYEMPAGANGWGSCIGEVKYWYDYPKGPRKKVVYGPGYVRKNIDFGVVNGKFALVGLTEAHAADEYSPTMGLFADPWDLNAMGKKYPIPAHDPSGLEGEFTSNPNFVRGPWIPWFYTGDRIDSDGKIGVDAAPYFLFRITGYDKDYFSCFNYYSDDPDGDSKNSICLIRLAEVYLWYAEAVARSGQGDQALAKKLVDQVKARAEDPVIPYSNLADEAVKQHGYETAGNIRGFATRYDDMRRLGLLQQHFDYRIKNNLGDNQNSPSVEYFDVTAKWLEEYPELKGYYNDLYPVATHPGAAKRYADDPANPRHKIIDGVYHIFMPNCYLPMNQNRTTWDEKACTEAPYPARDVLQIPTLIK